MSPGRVAPSVIMFGCLLLLGSSQTRVFAQSNNPPFLVCGARGWECSFILWNEHGSRGFVFGYPNMHFVISDQYLGFNWCSHAGPPGVSMPKWPECLSYPIVPEYRHGVIVRGRNE
jgi:hypothetical protein